MKFIVILLPTQEVFTEMEEKYGEVEEMNVCDNLGDHLVGNVYVKVGDGSVKRERKDVALDWVLHGVILNIILSENFSLCLHSFGHNWLYFATSCPQ